MSSNTLPKSWMDEEVTNVGAWVEEARTPMLKSVVVEMLPVLGVHGLERAAEKNKNKIQSR
jgi:hypothetical protein